MPFLRIRAGRDEGGRIPLDGENAILGREPGGIQVLDKAASRRHSEIFKIGELYFIRDLESRNGTYVNEEKISEELLKMGDRIRIGQTVYEFVEEGFDDEAVEFQPEEDLGGTTTTEITIDTKQFFNLTKEKGTPEADKLTALYKAAGELTRQDGPEAVMKRTAELARDAVGAEAAYVFTRNEEGEFHATAVVGNRTVKPSRTILKQAIANGQSILTADAATDVRFRRGASILASGIHSVLCVPLSVHDELHGVLYLGRNEIRAPFSREDLETVTLLGILAALALDNARSHAEQREMMLQTIKTLVAGIEASDPAMRGHAERVAGYAMAIAKQMNLPPAEAKPIQLAALLHDIGLLGTTGERERCDEDGRLVGRPAKHVEKGVEILSRIPGLRDLVPAVRHHHERFDGSGFPEGIAGNEIPLPARIVGVAEMFDLRTTTGGRAGEGIPVKDALVLFGKEANERFDPEVVRALIVAYRQGTLFSLDATVIADALEI